MKNAISKFEPNKEIKTDFDLIVKNIEIDNYLDLIEIDCEEKDTLFEKLTISKGTIYPLPKQNDILTIKKIFLDFDEDIISFRLFLKTEIKQKSQTNNINKINSENKSYSFSKTKIVESLKNICNINENLDTSIFRIDSINNKSYILFCFKDLKTYRFQKEDKTTFTIGDLILIANYLTTNNTEIKLSKISITKILNEEQLFRLRRFHDNKINIFKVIDIEEKYYTMINSAHELYLVKRNKALEKKEIKLCQLLLINYTINNIYNNKEDYPKEIDLDPNSIIYISTQDIYFSKLLNINKLSVININILDYNNKNKNYYEQINIEGKIFKIEKEKLFCVIYKDNIDNDYIPIKIKLMNTTEEKVFYFFYI